MAGGVGLEPNKTTGKGCPCLFLFLSSTYMRGEERLQIYEQSITHKAGSLKMNTALDYSTRVVQEGVVDVKKVLLTI
jgi:hypothetical protein